MKKIKTLFKIDRETHLIAPEVVEGSEWVINGEGISSEKINGTSCIIRDGKLFRRMVKKHLKVGNHVRINQIIKQGIGPAG